MKAFGISIAEGARITNVAVAAGDTFPSNPDEGELFFRYDADPTVRGLHCFTGGTWDRVGSTDALTAPSGANFPGTANVGDIFYKNSDDANEGLYVFNGSSWLAAASNPTPTYVVTGDVSGTLDGGTDVLTLTTAGKQSVSATAFNNNGNAHATTTDFNAVPGYGYSYIQNTTNGPGIASATQYYSTYEGLGSDYNATQYGMQMAIPRTPQGGSPYISVRFKEAGTWGSWSKIYAGSADNAITFDGFASSAAMLSRGSVAAASQDTATLNGFYVQDDGGAGSGLLVFSPGSSIGTVQQRFTYGGAFEFRNKTDSSSWTAWKTVLSSLNYNSYSPTLTGTGASGTWGISISGTAANASSISSAVGGTYTWTGANYFTSTGNTGPSVGAGLQAYGDASNGAYMAFHRSGVYAVNMGLDTDNVFRIGGWSAAANRLQLDMSGNLQVGGHLTSGGNVYTTQNYGYGLVGVYDSYKFQGVFAMGDAYKLPANGSSTTGLYGIAWTHPNAGGESKAGLSHQALFVTNGTTQTAIGTGIWTSGNISLATTNAFLNFADGNYIRQNTSSYGSMESGGSKNGYTGVYLPNGGATTVGMYDSSGNGGSYDTTWGWQHYWSRGNACLGIGGSTTAAGYRAYTNGAHYVAGKMVAVSNTTGVSTGVTAANGDLTAYRSGGTTGVVYLSSSGSNYVYFDGTNYNLNAGNIICTGNITAYSDIRVKRNIVQITDALSKVLQIRGVTFTRTDTDNPEQRHTGVIAQEVEKVLPEVITTAKAALDGSGMPETKSVAYGNMVGLLIEAIKELNAKVERLQAQLDARN